MTYPLKAVGQFSDLKNFYRGPADCEGYASRTQEALQVYILSIGAQ